MSGVLGKVAYKPVGLALGVAAGALSGLVFRQIWKRASGEDDAPSATDEERGWAEILAAAALQGLVFSVVRAAVDRAGASGVRRLTGYWPG
ncbi:DUF4235 domain-containing protein [Rugosimonospora africana]|uniref:Membrane protein n=1 Tax=Rugosimonospora africana TaxID=556532 RepID=A0A8J3QWU2_9ACTN|nr:DUF4235 domain-containing protein [Rugosimonospora africana]GIH17819.1 membrane protein [Rugosimonospora africana]